MQKQPQLHQFIEIYQKLNKDNLELLGEIYSADICFEDPMHQLNGLAALKQYFSHLYGNLNFCQFDISDSFMVNDLGFLYWTMHFSHPKLAQGKTISVDGHSRLKFKGRLVIAHRDYFNVADMLYKHIPILASAIKYLDKRAS